ncbi:TipAS antibiotic-recognition domain-containing protein [Paenibacillus sp. GYB003]|uniref:TipAS antibiotic-recognition domain-containing protein n=1 Tax=Paenibacillus sp. GYB003 TaxID=2994392 RepID=UPI002F962076
MGVWEYFTPEQQERLSKRIEQVKKQLGLEPFKRLRSESNEVVSKLIEGFENGIPPENEEMVALAKRLDESQALFNERDPEIERTVERFHVENPDEKEHGMDLNIYRYIEKAKSYIR